jgi:hypothetical protein
LVIGYIAQLLSVGIYYAALDWFRSLAGTVSFSEGGNAALTFAAASTGQAILTFGLSMGTWVESVVIFATGSRIRSNRSSLPKGWWKIWRVFPSDEIKTFYRTTALEWFLWLCVKSLMYIIVCFICYAFFLQGVHSQAIATQLVNVRVADTTGLSTITSIVASVFYLLEFLSRIKHYRFVEDEASAPALLLPAAPTAPDTIALGDTGESGGSGDTGTVGADSPTSPPSANGTEAEPPTT